LYGRGAGPAPESEPHVPRSGTAPGPRLLLFGKSPRPGRVKTRLVPPLDPEAAARLHAAFLSDQLAFVAAFRDRAGVEWWVDGPPGLEAPPGVRVREQGPGDLGVRLARAFARVHEEGATCAVVIGADSPTLPARTVRRAFERLEAGADAVLAPADDGGYVLLGARGPRPELFRDVPWGGPEVCRITRARAAEAGLGLDELAPWWDVDDERGLARLVAAATARRTRRRAPATCSCVLDWLEKGVI